MPKLECDVCSVDIERYYDLSLDIVGLNNKLCTMVTSSPSNANLLGPGRVVILRDGVCYLPITTLMTTDRAPIYNQHFRQGNVGVLLKPDPRQASSFAGKLFFVLAMVDQETKLGDTGIYLMAYAST